MLENGTWDVPKTMFLLFLSTSGSFVWYLYYQTSLGVRSRLQTNKKGNIFALGSDQNPINDKNLFADFVHPT